MNQTCTKICRIFLEKISIPNEEKLVQNYIRKWSPKEFYEVTLPDEGEVRMLTNPSDHVGAYYYYLNGYEKRICEIVRSHLKPGDVAFDIGTFYGFYSALFSKIVGDKGEVHAFEIDLKNFNITKKTILLNRSENVTLNFIAVAESDGLMEFISPESVANAYNFDSLKGNRGTGHLSYVKTNESISVKTLSLDSYVSEKKLDHIDFIKIDIEGYELPALRGMKNLIKKYQPLIIVEFGSVSALRTGYSLKEMYDFFIMNDYKLYNADSKLLVPIKRDELEKEPTYFNAFCMPNTK